MKTTRRNFLASIPALAILCGLKPKAKAPKPPRIETKWLYCKETATGVAGEIIVAGQCCFFGAEGKIYSKGNQIIGIALNKAMPHESVSILISDIQFCPGNIL